MNILFGYSKDMVNEPLHWLRWFRFRITTIFSNAAMERKRAGEGRKSVSFMQNTHCNCNVPIPCRLTLPSLSRCYSTCVFTIRLRYANIALLWHLRPKYQIYVKFTPLNFISEKNVFFLFIIILLFFFIKKKVLSK